jgi:hypothetical protein
MANTVFCIVQRETAQSRSGMVRGNGLAEAPPVSQAGWSDFMYFSRLLFVPVAHLEFQVSFCTYEGAVPYE